jgi:hypothetical protein
MIQTLTFALPNKNGAKSKHQKFFESLETTAQIFKIYKVMLAQILIRI